VLKGISDLVKLSTDGQGLLPSVDIEQGKEGSRLSEESGHGGVFTSDEEDNEHRQHADEPMAWVPS